MWRASFKDNPCESSVPKFKFLTDCIKLETSEILREQRTCIYEQGLNYFTATKDLQMRKWYSLIDKVYSLPNLSEAFDKVKRNKGSKTAGIDGVSVKNFREHLGDNLCQLHEELRSGTYKPQAVKRGYIEKEDGSKCPLGIPTMRDRVVQQALLNILQPIFEPDFHPSRFTNSIKIKMKQL